MVIELFSQTTNVPLSSDSWFTPNITTNNPLKLNGHKYAFTFNYVNDSTVTWNLFDVSQNILLLQKQSILGPAVTVDNMKITMNSKQNQGVKVCKVLTGVKRFTSVNASGYTLESFSGAIGYASPYTVLDGGAHEVPYTSLKNVVLKLARVIDTTSYNPQFDSSDPNVSYGYRYGRSFAYGPVDVKFSPYIINQTSGYSFQDFTKSVPLSAWDVSDPVHPRRLAVGHLENNVYLGLVDGKWWPGDYNLYNNTQTSGPREWLWIYDTDYSEIPNPAYEVDAMANPMPIMYLLTVNRNGPVPFSPGTSGDDQFIIQANYKDVELDTAYFIAATSDYQVPTSITKKLNLSNISTWEYNNGKSDIHPNGYPGSYYPKASQNNVMFQSGLVWGAVVSGDPQPRVGGSAYRQGLQPGKILEYLTAEYPGSTINRLYRVRADFKSADLEGEVSDEWIPKQTIYDTYAKDWDEWPAGRGAPFVDVNRNGQYDPAIDIPGIKGAGQTMWYVANDWDPQITTYMYGAQPIGIEMQATFWNYKMAGALGNTIFKKYLLINKSYEPRDSMYISMWSDPDLGDATDDFMGTDTLRHMVYCYNSKSTDAVCGNTPPAVGFVMLQTPVIFSSNDSAFTAGQWVKGKRNIPVNASYFFTNGDSLIADPTQGVPEGSTQFYNYMRGRIGKTGELFIDNNGNSTTFPLAGDPVANTGWVDGGSLHAGDRRMGICSGPFTFGPRDTQEVVFAEIVADATPETGNLGAITMLKQCCDSIRTVYRTLVNMPTGIKDGINPKSKKFALSQNYPNPFNPATVIRYDLPERGMATLKVFDVLGSEITTLVNEEKPAGSYQVEFNRTNIPSGVYFYRLSLGTYTDVKKMILLK